MEVGSLVGIKRVKDIKNVKSLETSPYFNQEIFDFLSEEGFKRSENDMFCMRIDKFYIIIKGNEICVILYNSSNLHNGKICYGEHDIKKVISFFAVGSFKNAYNELIDFIMFN